MVRYFTISLIVNLFLFYLYTLWIGENLLNAFKGFGKALPPLKVSIKVVEEKKEVKKAVRSVQTLPKKKRKGKVEIRNKPKNKSLLKDLLTSVESEIKTFYRKVQLPALAKFEKGKFKLNLKRKLVYVPEVKPITVEVPPAPAVVKITILPDGRVADVRFVKRSGNAKVDKAILNFLKSLKFEPIENPIIQEIEITFVF